LEAGVQKRTQRYGLFSLILTTIGVVSFAAVALAQNVEVGKQLYQQRCAPCHGPDGKANTPTAQALNPKPRDHTDGSYMNKLSQDHLVKVIKQGGAAVGKSPIMPPQADLNEQQIKDIVAFVRSLAVPPYQGN
jgi:mono/diheme cytochrome c family protein